MKKSEARSVRDQVLLAVAQRLGPAIDQIEMPERIDAWTVRDLLIAAPGLGISGSPAEIRGALLDLHDEGLVFLTSEELRSPDDSVALRTRGLLAARKLDPKCGQPTTPITLVMKRGRKAGVFDARLVTGDKDRDHELNKSGAALAAFYVLAARRPTQEHPLWLRDCAPMFARLARLGVGPKVGPGVRILVGSETMRKAIERWADLLALRTVRTDNDSRFIGWHLDGPFPGVRVEGATGRQFRSWAWMQFNLEQAVKGVPFPDAKHEIVAGLTDDQFEKLEREAQASDGDVQQP